MRPIGLAAMLCAALALAGGAAGQSVPPGETLEDVRQNLQAIDATVAALRAQLVAGGGGRATAGDLQRLDGIEGEVRRLTGRVEQLQNDIRRMADDAGRRYADVEFRLTEIEGGDTALLGDAAPLGGGVSGTAAGTVPGGGPAGVIDPEAPGVATAVSEQNAFDAADALRAEGRTAEAAAAFQAFLADFPGSPLTADATFALAEARFALGAHRDAAKSYLASFNSAPTGANAPAALLGIGASLQVLGQFPEACLTFAEVLRRFPAGPSDVLVRANDGRAEIGCQ